MKSRESLGSALPNKNQRSGAGLPTTTALWLLTPALILATLNDAGACASCGCTLSPDWDTLQTSKSTGFKVDLRYDYLNQDQLRSGRNAISSEAASRVMNNGDPQEVEKYTQNRYTTLGIDYADTQNWGINISVPYIDRQHSSLGVNSNGQAPADGAYDSHTANLGDIKVIGRHQGLTERFSTSLLFGLKLPSGSHTQTGTATDPATPGEIAMIDRGLQPGTGTTDAIVGLLVADNLNLQWEYFGELLYQQALNSRDDYRPGNGVNLNLGLRYAGFPGYYPNLQLNVRAVRPDSGANADTISTGGTLVYLSPGLTVPLSPQVSIFGFVQLPVYQYVNGVQLAPSFTASLGARYSF